MTPEELEAFRLNARILALEAVVAALISAGIHTPAGRQEQRAELDRWLESLRDLKFPGAPPEYADLLNAEVQQAAESLFSFIKSTLNKRSRTP
ncbi:MAG TPA: hypothetical protein VK700_00225 [Steroidobacteraceae bacterium]|jgi:hypothetical protein|nr:hypothetical protein [Steroidobacteraceae bacterium]